MAVSHRQSEIVIDEGCYLAHQENAGTKGADQGYTMDANGPYVPAIDCFPSAVQTMSI